MSIEKFVVKMQDGFSINVELERQVNTYVPRQSSAIGGFENPDGTLNLSDSQRLESMAAMYACELLNQDITDNARIERLKQNGKKEEGDSAQ